MRLPIFLSVYYKLAKIENDFFIDWNLTSHCVLSLLTNSFLHEIVKRSERPCQIISYNMIISFQNSLKKVQHVVFLNFVGTWWDQFNFANLLLDGNWGVWSSWSTCSVSCGGGNQSRNRLCNNPAPSNGGLPCSGSSSESGACNTQTCSNATAQGYYVLVSILKMIVIEIDGFARLIIY